MRNHDTGPSLGLEASGGHFPPRFLDVQNLDDTNLIEVTVMSEKNPTLGTDCQGTDNAVAVRADHGHSLPASLIQISLLPPGAPVGVTTALGKTELTGPAHTDPVIMSRGLEGVPTAMGTCPRRFLHGGDPLPEKAEIRLGWGE
jgi:hypothetical protein